MKAKITYFIIFFLTINCANIFSQNYFDLSTGNFSQNWSNTGLITTNNDWSALPNIRGFKDDLAGSTTAVDPQTILGDQTTLNVNANQTNPNTYTTGGITEFEITNPVVAIKGSGTADAPYMVFYLDASGVTSVTFQCLLRDIDASTNNSIQPIAFQYRVGTTGNFTNIPSAFVADASAGPSLTLDTPVNFTLPSNCDNQSQLQVRVITTNAVGADEYIGIDDIVISGTASLTPTKLLITSVNNGVNPYLNTSFYVVVKSADLNSNPSNVLSDVNYTLNLATGSGILGGTLSGTIEAGKNVDTLFGVTYNTIETGVSVTATDNATVLSSATSALFEVIALPPSPVKLAITDVNGGNEPYVNTSFAVTVKSWDSSNNPVNVVSPVNFTISLENGTGILSGTLTGTIASDTNSTTVSGLKYSSVENNITIKANDDALLLANGISNPFNVIAFPSPAAIVITEINYNDPSVADSLEYIELFNNGATAVNLAGYKFTSGINYNLPNIVLNPGNYFVVAKDSNAVQNFYGITGVRKWGASDALNNSGEAIALKDNFNQLVDTVFYDDVAPWVTLPDGSGPSLVLCDPNNDNNIAANWTAATEYVGMLNGVAVYGNPKAGCAPVVDITPPLVLNAVALNNNLIKVSFNEAVNTTAENISNYSGVGTINTAVRNVFNDTVSITLATPLLNGVQYTITISGVQDIAGNPMASPQMFDVMFNSSVENIVITEIMYNDPSLNDDSLEFVELYNNSLSAANISGYVFTKGIEYVFPNNTVMPPASYLIIAKKSIAVANFFSLSGVLQWNNGAVLSNAGESLEIKNMAGVVIDSLTYKVTSPWPASPNGNGPSLSLCDPSSENSLGSNWSASTEQVALLNAIMVKASPGAGCSPATFPPVVLNAWATSLSSVKVVFDKPVDISAENTSNYTGLGTLVSATRNATFDTISLSLSTPLLPGISKILTVSGVSDINGTMMPAPQNFVVIFNDLIFDIVITEIMYNDPSSTVDSLEFIELYNNSGFDANISDFRFSTAIEYTFPPNTILGIGSYLVVAKNANAVASFFSISNVLQWNTNSVLNNTGEKIVLANSAGNIIDSLTYRTSSPWPTSPNGNGPSLTLCDPSADNSLGINWSASTEPVAMLNGIMVYATPGAACVSTGIENVNAASFVVYPNPCSEELYITNPLNSKIKIKLFDITGILIKFAEGNNSNIAIDFRDLPQGIYIIEVTDIDNQRIKTFKITKL